MASHKKTPNKKTIILVTAIAATVIVIMAAMILQQNSKTIKIPDTAIMENKETAQKLQTKNVTIQKAEENITINAEIANDNEERSKGLMYRTELGEYDGMIFIFGNEKKLIFWMKNTLIPLDIIFADETGRIMNIEEAQPCKQETCPLYSSDENAQFALELNQGFCKKHNIQKGDRIII